MVVWSSLCKLTPRIAFHGTRNNVLQRYMSNEFRIQPSRWQWHKFKDYLHFYVMVGLIPIGLILGYSNIFVGPATLAEIPEGYVPKYWEYYQHPFTRFLARYCFPIPQQEYEKFLHHIYEEEEKRQLRLLQKKILQKMGERGDYQGYYYRPYTEVIKGRRVNKELEDERSKKAGNSDFVEF
ncbi:NADH dehydrogenase [ubiquinone] 1 beta subcomplex subunit 5, mitochondrial [Bacillus rossius redtenbacheri]|uniref:NADH dehydrogenase [ubiquinone] 1 beta subcomplex subunit 5, mitochondrial n=1 Tax=Bacillus rossius redtenbacheri TaxID=93214 RepID=UPI002FDCEDB9